MLNLDSRLFRLADRLMHFPVLSLTINPAVPAGTHQAEFGQSAYHLDRQREQRVSLPAVVPHSAHAFCCGFAPAPMPACAMPASVASCDGSPAPGPLLAPLFAAALPSPLSPLPAAAPPFASRSRASLQNAGSGIPFFLKKSGPGPDSHSTQLLVRFSALYSQTFAVVPHFAEHRAARRGDFLRHHLRGFARSKNSQQFSSCCSALTSRSLRFWSGPAALNAGERCRIARARLTAFIAGSGSIVAMQACARFISDASSR